MSAWKRPANTCFDFGDLAPQPDMTLPAPARKGRGAVTNRPGRFEPGDRPREDDGWLTQDEESDLPPLRTTVSLDTSKSIIARNDSTRASSAARSTGTPSRRARAIAADRIAARSTARSTR